MPRLFFAVWPDAQTANDLALLAMKLAAQTGGRPVPAEKIHLTLAFLGAVEEERRSAVVDAAALRGRPFDMSLDTVGSFRRAGVAWIGASEPPPPLLALQSRLASRLRDRGFELEARNFAPHVTLARRALRPAAAASIAPRTWRVSELTLVRSEMGTGRYSIEQRWKLSR